MIVASVNGYEINEREFQAELNKVLGEKINDQSTREIREKAVNNLVDAALILQEANNLNIAISEDQLEHEFLDFMMQFKDQEEYLVSLKKNETTNELIRNYLHNKLIVKEYLNRFVNEDDSPEPGEGQLLDFYEANLDFFRIGEVIKVSHILISNENGLFKAKEMRQKIRTPEDFLAIAERCSECPSCCQSGELGYIKKGVMVPEFDEVAFKLGINEISEPVKTKYGYHIIMLTDRKNSFTMAYDDVKEALKKRLKRIDYELKILHHMKALRNKAEVYVNPQVLDA
jgi:parvulin-like peptidyl-prolyl isomerase